MSFKFNRALDKVANIFKNSISQKKNEINIVFKGMMKKLEKTAYYEKYSSKDLPIIEFNAYLKLKMPFNIELDFQIPTLKPIQLSMKVNYPIINDDVIKPYLWNNLMGAELKKSGMGPITCKVGAVFKLCTKKSDSKGHTITARVLTELQADVNKVIFSLMPAIMIIKDESTPLLSWLSCSENRKYWSAVPFSGHCERNHCGINHKWWNVKRSAKIKATNLMLLLQTFLQEITRIITFILKWLDQENKVSVLSDPLGASLMDELCFEFLLEITFLKHILYLNESDPFEILGISVEAAKLFEKFISHLILFVIIP